MGFRNTVTDAGSVGPVLPTKAASLVTTFNGSNSLTIPATAQAGDTALVFCNTRNNSNGSATIASVSSFSRLFYMSFAPASWDCTHVQWKKLSETDPGATYSVTTGGLTSDKYVNAYLIRGGDSQAPRPVWNNFQQITDGGGSISNPVFPTGTRIKGDLLIVHPADPLGFGGTTPSWPAAGSGGPPAPQPAWNEQTVQCNWENYADYSINVQGSMALAYVVKAGA